MQPIFHDTLTFRGNRLGRYTVGGEPFDFRGTTANWTRNFAHYELDWGKCVTLVRVYGGVVAPIDATWLNGPYVVGRGRNSFQLNFRNGILTTYRKVDLRWELVARNLLGPSKCLEDHEAWSIRRVREYLTLQGITTPEALLELLQFGRNRRMDCWDLLKQPRSKAAKRLTRVVASTLSIDVSQKAYTDDQQQPLTDGDVRRGMVVYTPHPKYAHLSHSLRVMVASFMWWTPLPLWEGGKFATWFMGEQLDDQEAIRNIEMSAQRVDSFGAMRTGLIGGPPPIL